MGLSVDTTKGVQQWAHDLPEEVKKKRLKVPACSPE